MQRATEGRSHCEALWAECREDGRALTGDEHQAWQHHADDHDIGVLAEVTSPQHRDQHQRGIDHSDQYHNGTQQGSQCVGDGRHGRHA